MLGADNCAQQNVAAQMQHRAPTSKPDYVINVGDNFYWAGITTKCGAPTFKCNDATGQWKAVYESMYAGPGLDGKQWLGVLGNHDFGGYTFTNGWDQAIGYTWAKLSSSTDRWMTPALYYSAKVHYPDFSVDYYFLDSNVFDAFLPDADQGHNLCSRIHNPAVGSTCGVQGPVSVEDCHPWFDKLWKAEVVWLEDELNRSGSDWQIVVTHFPPVHGKEDWMRLTKKYGIDLIITGHQHQQEVHYRDESNFLRPTAFVISGGGGGITSEGTPDAMGNDDQYGFMDLTLSRKEIMIEAISHGGQVRSRTCVVQVYPGGKPENNIGGPSLCQPMDAGLAEILPKSTWDIDWDLDKRDEKREEDDSNITPSYDIFSDDDDGMPTNNSDGVPQDGAAAKPLDPSLGLDNEGYASLLIPLAPLATPEGHALPSTTVAITPTTAVPLHV